MIGASETADCECGARETVSHYLLDCPRWSSPREKLKKEAGRRWGDLPYMVGGWSDRRTPNGELIDGPMEKWKPDHRIVAATLEFVRATGRLNVQEQPDPQADE